MWLKKGGDFVAGKGGQRGGEVASSYMDNNLLMLSCRKYFDLSSKSISNVVGNEVKFLNDLSFLTVPINYGFRDI